MVDASCQGIILVSWRADLKMQAARELYWYPEELI
jgi:hypothetical protein